MNDIVQQLQKLLCLSLGMLTVACSTLSVPPLVDSPMWVELGPDGIVLARAIVSDVCPQVIADGKTLTMHERGSFDAKAFPVKSCEVTLPAHTQRAAIGKQELKIPMANIDRIVVIADTGCRLKTVGSSTVTQDCNDPVKWPFAQVAKTAAEWKPDLVIHVGDYHYREAPCPEGVESCAGTVSGDQWESWQQDFFAPASVLLKAAPWILVRGNHELCERSGKGWFELLDSRPFPSQCEDRTSPFVVPLKDHKFFVVDSADENNIQPSLNELASKVTGFSWLLLHRPFLSPGVAASPKTDIRLPKALAAPGRLALILAGHKHHLALNRFHSMPPELIGGNSGSALEAMPAKDTPVLSDQTTVALSSILYWNFGFMTFEREGQGAWLLKAHRPTGELVASCRIFENLKQKTRMECEGHG